MFNLAYDKDEGMVKIPDQEPRIVKKFVNAISDDDLSLRLLGRHEWMMEGPNVFNSVKRWWESETNIKVSLDLVKFPPGILFDPLGLQTLQQPIRIEKVWEVQEKITEVNHEANH